MAFADRTAAGLRLAEELAGRGYDAPVVLGLPRGGVPVAFEVALRLRAPLDVLVVRKLGCPGQPELGLGAVSEDGLEVLNHRLIAELNIAPSVLDKVRRTERSELERRLLRYRRGRPAVELAGHTALLVDDGLATGFTAKAAIEVARSRHADRVVIAVPVAPAATVSELSRVADEVVCLLQPRWFTAVGEFYADFRQTTDEEVAELLERAAVAHAWQPGGRSHPGHRGRLRGRPHFGHVGP